LDLTVPAENGLRRGRTTGTCATAALKAALLRLLRQETVTEVSVSLPDRHGAAESASKYFLTVPIREVRRLDDGAVRAAVVKDAGDDPDCTDGAVISVLVRVNHRGELRFRAGPGVGTVTEPGIRVPVGEPAINPMPRQMMRWAAEEVLAGSVNPGFDVEIGCEDGATIARKTFNPRLGILGGISILGTTGVVEPMSLAAYMASIEVYIRVALGGGTDSVAYAPGKIGTAYAHKTLSLPRKRVVQISNFIGFALDCTNLVLAEEGRRLELLWLGIPESWRKRSMTSGIPTLEKARWPWARWRALPRRPALRRRMLRRCGQRTPWKRLSKGCASTSAQMSCGAR
jgi:cobalt-precorrin-5B (C1)-methyltransferase